MPTTFFLKKYLAQTRAAEADQQTADNTQFTLSVSAPGSGKALVIHSFRVSYTDNSAHDWTASWTDRDGTSKSQTFESGKSGGVAFPSSHLAFIATNENTSVSLDVPASGTAGETGRGTIVYSVVDEEALADVLS